jgi:tetrapyrrole methylase family protein/MazG family protein/ATP diphosphatase
MTRPAPADPDPLTRLITIMARLRDPDGGCPWDIEQTFATIAPYTVEEAYEVADAIAREDLGDLKDELGDLLLQVVFHARMAEEQGAFAFADVAEAICAKMIRRHPHVFADVRHRDVAEQSAAWEAIKAQERAGKAASAPSALDGVPTALPALTRAVKLTARAARVGFDWPTVEPVLDKVREELAELEVEIDAGEVGKATEELGDLLFVCANLARKMKVDPEAVLRAANLKFARRFNRVERLLAEAGKRPEDSDLAEMDALWDEAKREERLPPAAAVRSA